MSKMVPFDACHTVNGERTYLLLAGEEITANLAIAPAVHDGAFGGGWVLVHVSSGMPLYPPAMCLRCLREAAAKVAAAPVDWTMHEDVLRATPAARAAMQHLLDEWTLCQGVRCERDWPDDDDLGDDDPQDAAPEQWLDDAGAEATGR
uniref:hypothetical protein n=1 Tax=Actinoplanes sp. CA-151224 TaxID=3239904 RepID=UPI003F499065